MGKMRAHNIFPLRGKENKLLGPHLQLYCPSRNRLESFWKSVTPFESKKNPKKRAFEREILGSTTNTIGTGWQCHSGGKNVTFNYLLGA